MKLLAISSLGIACVIAGVATVRAVDLQTLVDRSPFSPMAQEAGGAGVPEPRDTLEFRGIATDAEGTAYSIFDTATNKGRWLRADDQADAIRVTGFDMADGTLELERNGRPLRLSLKRATIQAGQAVAEMTAAAPSSPNGGFVIGRRTGTPANKVNAANVERLKAAAEAVRLQRKQRNADAAKLRSPAQPGPVSPSSGS